MRVAPTCVCARVSVRAALVLRPRLAANVDFARQISLRRIKWVFALLSARANQSFWREKVAPPKRQSDRQFARKFLSN